MHIKITIEETIQNSISEIWLANDSSSQNIGCTSLKMADMDEIRMHIGNFF